MTVVLPRGTRPADVPERLKLYENIRYERAHTIQGHSRSIGTDWKNGKPQVDQEATVYGSFNFAYDAHDHAQNMFRRHLWAKKKDARWTMPTSFGPFPRFRDEALSRHDFQQTFTTATVRFKTSRTYLECLLPTESYRFTAEDTACEASFSVTTQRNVSWLGGSDYSRFGLYIHDVQYDRNHGTAVQGTFVPVLMENSVEMAISTREEQGMPALFCDIEVDSLSQSYRIKASSRGVTFAELLLEDLKDGSEGPNEKMLGCNLLAHRFVPPVGDPRKPGEAFAVMATNKEVADASCKTTKTLRSDKASIKLDSCDGESLPTLHHVAADLANMPVYSIVTANVVSGTGVPDTLRYTRIEPALTVVFYRTQTESPSPGSQSHNLFGIRMLPAQSSQSPVNTMVDNLLPIPKRFITGHNQDGKAIFDTTLKDELPETLVGSHKFFLGYVPIEHPVDLDDNKDIKAYQQYLADPPGLALPGGSVLRYVDFPPGNSAMHRTVSMDYGIVLEGELKLVLDSGECREMKRGDVAIQRGTMHQWVNPSGSEWARMVFVLQESKPLTVNGVTLGEEYGDLSGQLRPSRE
ncbi:hypothetical protein FDECE_5441 [Fusarium decemcellulare]|nr:hypothetical protein FDECE_5441 [Fusarium decemcellulare]